jgi:hypothetical protein
LKTFTESGLTFSFSERWNVLKYDEHRFYRYLSGAGFKGVDFIGILDEKQLVLIEVKNYNDRFKPDESDPTKGLVAAPLSYATEYSQKFEDTFQLIAIIRKYYKRKWWFRKVRKWMLQFIPRHILLRYDWGFWNVVIQLIDEKREKVLLVLWLELNNELAVSKIKITITQIQQYLQKQFKKIKAEVIVTNSKESILGFEGKFK